MLILGQCRAGCTSDAFTDRDALTDLAANRPLSKICFEHQRNGFKGNFTILNIVLFMSSLIIIHIMPGNHSTLRIRSKTPPNIKLTFLSFFFCRCVFPKQLMTQHLRCKVLLRQFRKYSDDYLFCKMPMIGFIFSSQRPLLFKLPLSL